MKKNSGSWNWVEVSAKDLAGQTFESLTAKYRTEKPVGLLTRFQHLEGYAVLNILAPIHASFWAAVNGTRFTSRCFELLTNLYRDREARELFVKDLRQAKIRKTDRQIKLFEKYAQILQFSGESVPSLGEGPSNYSEMWRFDSVGFPNNYIDPVMQYLEQESGELGKYAFLRIDESINLADPRGLSSLGAYLFHNIDYRFHGNPLEREQFKNEVLRELKIAVHKLEDGIGFNTPIEPIWLIKGQVGFSLSPAVGQNPPEFEDTVAREILSYRARLIRLLGWPHQYNSVLNELEKFRQQIEGLKIHKFEPFDIEFELQSYLDEMKLRYPILGYRFLE